MTYLTAPSSALAQAQRTSALLSAINAKAIDFNDIIAHINQHYSFVPTAFYNGCQYNSAAHNQGSARVLYFAMLCGLSELDTLSLFAEHYQSVLATPTGTDHQNIRQFNYYGWSGVRFTGAALIAK